MTKKQSSLEDESHRDSHAAVELRTIRESDQPQLRAWTNQNRQYFFFKELISEFAQQEWFGKYLTRDDDYMFIVRAEGCSIGCMGIRVLEDTWDVYNVILGEQRFSGRGYMGQALQTMCSWAAELRPIRISARVLKDNPAINWYCRNGFKVVATHDDHVEIELDGVTRSSSRR
jgi:RimJ/RimL family protein N-acetyltransferase